MIVYIMDSDSNDDGTFEEWSDPEDDQLVQIDRRIREKEAIDAEVAKKCHEDAERHEKELVERHAEVAKMCHEEMERKAREKVETHNEVARMCQNLYYQNATDEKIKRASALFVVGQPIPNVARESSAEGGQTPDIGVHTSLDVGQHAELTGSNFMAERGIADSASPRGQDNVKRAKQRRSKRGSKRERSKNRRKVRFSNIVQAICPTESLETNDTSSDDGNVASAEDDGGPNRARVNNSLENDISESRNRVPGAMG
ncbi:hypothetical protein ACQJBY_011527 [Aegilops geniculata]